MITIKKNNLVIILFYVLFNTCIIKLVYASCPNDCSGHGLCNVGNVCICYTGWNGGAADCSYRKFLFEYIFVNIIININNDM